MRPVGFEPTIAVGERQHTPRSRPRGHWDRHFSGVALEYDEVTILIYAADLQVIVEIPCAVVIDCKIRVYHRLCSLVNFELFLLPLRVPDIEQRCDPLTHIRGVNVLR
jgi:hypothetical protein